MDDIAWPDQTLEQLEGEDWGEPAYPSCVVTNSHRLRKKPLREFTAEDLRFMLGQQISLPISMPMALDVLELVDPFAGGDMNQGTLLLNALKVDKQFWQDIRSYGIGSMLCWWISIICANSSSRS